MMRADTFFAGQITRQACAPGRVNLLGEHTDYNQGYMLPIATPQRTRVTLAASADRFWHFHSAAFSQTLIWDGSEQPVSGFGRFLAGCISVLRRRGILCPPLRMLVESDLPIGAGLSSSAALEVATLRALREWLQITLDDVSLACLAQRAEIDYVGVRCGILDQMASSLADVSHMLFIDARTLAWQRLDLPWGAELIVIDSGVSRTLDTSAYNTRQAECQTAARMLGVPALRDVTNPAVVAALPQPGQRRARHVVTENRRVLAACASHSAARFGALMNASHASLRDDFAVSAAPLDQLTALLRRDPGVFGAKLTGAGFGGACVALCRTGHGARIAAAVVQRFNSRGGGARVLIPPPLPLSPCLSPAPAPTRALALRRPEPG